VAPQHIVSGALTPSFIFGFARPLCDDLLRGWSRVGHRAFA
jgi:hypothetical protein